MWKIYGSRGFAKRIMPVRPALQIEKEWFQPNALLTSKLNRLKENELHFSFLEGNILDYAKKVLITVGSPGSGKAAILDRLKKLGFQVINLSFIELFEVKT